MFAQGHRRLTTSGIYAVVTACSYALAFGIRFEFSWPLEYWRLFWGTVTVLVALRIIVALATRLGIGSWRYVGIHDLLRLTVAMLAGSIAFFAITWTLPIFPRVPRSVIVLEFLLTGNAIAAIWVSYRLFFEKVTHRRRSVDDLKRVVVVGAGMAGQMLVREIGRFPTAYEPVGFVDDDPMKWGSRIHGVEVIGAVDDLATIAADVAAELILIAIPSAEPQQLRRIIEVCEDLDIGFKLLPGIREVLEGDAHLHQLREVRVEDLLGREPVQLALPELAEDLRNEVVLITGAAGSIGSELARQVALHSPRMLILLDHAETPLYFVDLELRQAHPALAIDARLVDVTDRSRVEAVFSEYRPTRVYHAAAYKHVPMMEEHPRAAVRNNVIGTWLVAQCAGLCGTTQFVLVSTDKAVRPANIMGATKRIAELVTLHMQERYPQTAFGAVRFGNVLGSNGSVIPLFERQLAAGEPLTVTHEDVTRYFMTIPEAVQLILQAALLPRMKGGIAMLEMGEPVPIMELARNLLRLSGKPARVGREIIITGLRPGEKLHEELAAPEERAIPTGLEKVNLLDTSNIALPKAVADAIDRADLEQVLMYLREEIIDCRLDSSMALGTQEGVLPGV